MPDYQRGYSWDESNVREFLSDLDYLQADRNHYTGTLVLHEDSQDKEYLDAEDTPLTPLAVVDGQQRLTTIVILLNSLSLALERAATDDASDRIRKVAHAIRSNFIETEGANGQPIHRLALNQGANNFFHRHVLAREPGIHGPQIPSETRLLRAKVVIDAYIDKNVSGRDPKSVREFLLDLHRKVADRLRFSLYEVEQEAEVGVIFEVMNDRGKPLSELEKVKNYLLYAGATIGLVNDLAASVNSAWENILSGLMNAGLESSKDENSLLRAQWVVAYDYQPRKWRGVKSVKERFNVRSSDQDRKKLLDDLVTYTKRLEDTCVPFCDAYAPIQVGSFSSFADQTNQRNLVIEWSDRFRRLDTLVPFVPLLVAVRLRYPKDTGKYLHVLQLCENYAFRVFTLKESRTDAGQAGMFQIGNQLASRAIAYDDMIEVLQRLLARRCSDAEFEGLLETRGDWYEWRGLQYFLYEYETHLAAASGASPHVSWQDLKRKDKRDTVEHILPQNIERREYWRTRFDNEAHNRLRHDLGNLTLTRGNSVLSDKPFPKKKGDPSSKKYSYSTSPLFAERELQAWEDWTPEAIEHRRQKIVAWARERWAVKPIAED